MRRAMAVTALALCVLTADAEPARLYPWETLTYEVVYLGDLSPGRDRWAFAYGYWMALSSIVKLEESGTDIGRILDAMRDIVTRDTRTFREEYFDGYRGNPRVHVSMVPWYPYFGKEAR